MRYAICLLALFLTSCIDSDIESFTDPDYLGVKFTRLIVDLNSIPDSAKLEASKQILKRLKDSNFDVVDINQLIPPTRNYTSENIQTLIASSGYDGVLRIIVTSDNAQRSVAGYMSNSSGYANYTPNGIYANSQSVTIPMVAAKGQTNTTTIIYDTKGLQIAWKANIATKASGTAFVGNVSSIANSVIGKVIDQLKADGH
jgi:hypothetical protein